MYKNIIAFDIDGVVADTYKSIRKRIIDDYSYDIEGNVSKHEIVVPNVDRKEVLNRIYNTMEYSVIDPCDNAVDSLTKVYKMIGEEITFLTARPHFLVDTTYKWLDKIIPNIKYKIIFAQSSQKYKFLDKYGFKFMVDDRIKVINSIPNRMTGFLVNREWNANRETNDNVIRVNSLKEVVKLLNKLYN